MLVRALLLSALLGTTPCLARDYDFGFDNLANVSDRLGNLVTVSNRPNGTSSTLQLTSINRYGNVNWDRSHSDGYLERATSFFIDASGSLVMAGVRVWNSVNYIWVMKYSNSGQLLWERADVKAGCTAFDIVANAAGDLWIAGSCIDGQSYPVRLLHYDQNGGLRWAQDYNEGGRNYVRNLSLDFIGRTSMTVEVIGGFGRNARTVVYDGYGSRVASY